MRGELNGLVRCKKAGYTKSVEILVNLFALGFCNNVKLNAT